MCNQENILPRLEEVKVHVFINRCLESDVLLHRNILIDLKHDAFSMVVSVEKLLCVFAQRRVFVVVNAYVDPTISLTNFLQNSESEKYKIDHIDKTYSL